MEEKTMTIRQVGRVSTRIKRKGIGKVLIPFYNS